MELHSSQQRQIQSIQVLRALGIFVILSAHIGLAAAFGDPTLAPDVPRWLVMLIGNASDGMLDIFFAGSGFVMVYITQGQVGSKRAAQKFIVARITKIVPIYWVYMTLAVGMGFIIGDVAGFQEPTFTRVIKSYLFIPYGTDVMPDVFGGAHLWVRPMLPAGWTLNFEIWFYVVFMLGLLLPRVQGLLAMTVFALVMAAMRPYVPLNWVATHFWMSSTILKFLAGCWIGYAYVRGVQYMTARWKVLAIGLLAFCAHWCVYALYLDRPDTFMFHLWGAVFSGIMIGCAVLTTFSDARNTPRWLVELGNSTYSIYLCHVFVYVPVFAVCGLFFELTMPQRVAVAVGCFFASLLLGWISYRKLELPLIALVRSRFKQA